MTLKERLVTKCRITRVYEKGGILLPEPETNFADDKLISRKTFHRVTECLRSANARLSACLVGFLQSKQSLRTHAT